MVATRICRACRWLADCRREHGAYPDDPACTGFVSANTDPALREVLSQAFIPANQEPTQ